MHVEMVMILFGVLTATQIGMLAWKRNHPKSFQRVTLLGLWIIPVIVSLRMGFWRFVGVWTTFTVINMTVVARAWRQPFCHNTPRAVFKWYLICYHVCKVCSLGGILIIILDICDIWRAGAFDVAAMLLFYGLYFGVLSRDFADMCSDRIATTLGFYSPDGIPSRGFNPSICGVCAKPFGSDEQKPVMMPTPGIEMPPPELALPAGPLSFHQRCYAEAMSHGPSTEKTIKLECGHIFHEWCIRGWCIIGKKNTCPVCKEKVDLRTLSTTPWQTANLMLTGVFDTVRYLVVWNPLMIVAFKLIVWALQLK
eukprot:Unigene5746_Nuclearia_a/m.17559 Unigene5746_Nuclearia_a/g.17559  ORF Unigene5746_Nuclearia_a/g.17559 Unigene5746_Nuclearia_a/m.17559 type:complete len:309 (+) Unigene5746_Nuclearia_a:302-1228(+)